ncbi:MAG: hypothetical protein A4E72_02221 [Syntrophus sp. PtaU1.Bin208]|nr:MAG: hypothetical protein A4E72_02221 [Syntrophus sp. PtaU1.Bin208]
MNRKGQGFFAKVGLFFSACLSLAGMAGLLVVIRMGLLPSGNPMGHSDEYQQGWALFFLLFLGMPCLLAFIGGLIPLISWIMRSGTKQGEVDRHHDLSVSAPPGGNSHQPK